MIFIQMVIAALLVMGTVISGFTGELVTFKGEGQEILTAKLTKPEGKGPFPALILLHGGYEMDRNYDIWTERLTGWGYVALQVKKVAP